MQLPVLCLALTTERASVRIPAAAISNGGNGDSFLPIQVRVEAAGSRVTRLRGRGRARDDARKGRTPRQSPGKALNQLITASLRPRCGLP